MTSWGLRVAIRQHRTEVRRSRAAKRQMNCMAVPRLPGKRGISSLVPAALYTFMYIICAYICRGRCISVICVHSLSWSQSSEDGGSGT